MMPPQKRKQTVLQHDNNTDEKSSESVSTFMVRAEILFSFPPPHVVMKLITMSEKKHL